MVCSAKRSTKRTTVLMVGGLRYTEAAGRGAQVVGIVPADAWGSRRALYPLGMVETSILSGRKL